MKGSYLLLIELSDKKTIQIGKLGLIDFPKASYLYLGSAMNGIEQRIKRHFSKNKNHHWHIDYFLDSAQLKQAFYKQNDQKEECMISEELHGSFDSMPFFGSSDCECKSHLFYGNHTSLIDCLSVLGFVYFEEKNLI